MREGHCVYLLDDGHRDYHHDRAERKHHHRTESSCGDEFTACGATDIEATTTKVPENCPLPTDNAKRGIVDDGPKLIRRQNEQRLAGCPANAVIYPKNPDNVGDIPQLLSEYDGKYVQVQSKQFSYTAFFWVPYLDAQTMAKVQQSVSIHESSIKRLATNAGL